MSIIRTLDEMAIDLQFLKDWLTRSVAIGDWYAVADVTREIREMEAAIDVVRRYLPKVVVEGEVQLEDVQRVLTAETRPKICEDCTCGKNTGCGS